MPVIRPWANAWQRGILLFLVAAASHGVYSYHSVKVPYVFGDEAGYLLKAASLAGYGTDAYSSYFPAYALLIVPAFLLGGADPLRIFHLVQAVNALLAGAGALLLLALARRWWPAAPPRRAWVAALVVSLYPPFMAFSSFALSENLFVPLATALGLYVFRYAGEPGRGRWQLGALCGLLALTHPKGMVVAAVAGLAVLPVIWRGRRWRDALLVASVAAAVFLPTWLALDAFFKSRLGALPGHYPGAGSVLESVKQLIDRHVLVDFLEHMLGQVFYLMAASMGLAAIGAGLLGRRLLQSMERGEPGQRAFSVYALLAVAATVLMTALFMRTGTRIDQLFYGRYNEGVVALLMLPAVLEPSRPRAWLDTALVLLLIGATIAWRYGDPLGGWLVEVNIIGVQLWRGLLGDVISVDGLHVLPIALATALLLLGLSRFARGAWLPALMLAIFLVDARVAGYAYLRPSSDQHANQHAIADYVKAIYPEARCVDYDTAHGDYWGRYNYQFFLLPLRQNEVQLEPGARGGRCSDLVISSNPGLQGLFPEAKLLLKENDSSQALWRVPR